MTPARRRGLARVALALAVLLMGWGLVLVVAGGVNTTVFGLTVRSNDPARPLLLGGVSLVLFVMARGPGALVAALRALVSRGARRFSWLGRLARVDDRVTAGALAAITCAMGLAYCTETVGGSDTYGYVSQADLWLSGHLVVPERYVSRVPWPSGRVTFAPLGYRPIGQERYWGNVPVYAAGLPLLLAAAKFIAGQRALFWVSPLCGGLLVLATFGVGRRLGQSRAGLVAAWLMTTSPPLLVMMMVPMSDVPVAAAWTIAFWCLLGDTTASAAGAGVATAMAILIRPNLVPVAAPLGLWYLWKAWRGDTRGRRRLFGFVVGALPGTIAIAVINWKLYGSPFTSGYGALSTIFSWGHIPTNARDYIKFFGQIETPIVYLGLVALFLPSTRFWPHLKDRGIFAVLGAFVFGVWLIYCAYLVFGDWSYLRFLLVTFPLILVGVGQLTVVTGRLGGPALKAALVLLILGVGVRNFWLAKEDGAFGQRKGDWKYAAVGELVRRHTERNAVVMTLLHSGSVRYYAGRNTLRFDLLEPDWLDRAVIWTTSKQVRMYALLEGSEVEQFRQRFGAANPWLGQLKMQPVAEYFGSAHVILYDLLRPAGPAPTERVDETFANMRCLRPAPPPQLVFREK